MESCNKMPDHSPSQGFSNEFTSFSEQSSECLFPWTRPTFSSGAAKQVPLYNDDQDSLCQPPKSAEAASESEQRENALRTPHELSRNSQLSANSVRDGLSFLADGGLQPQGSSNLARVRWVARDLSQYAVVSYLLDLRPEDLEKSLEYQEKIERRKVEMRQWKDRIDMKISTSRDQCKELFELLIRQNRAIQDHCQERKQQLRANFNNLRAQNLDHYLLLEDFPRKYSAGIERLKERVKEKEGEMKKQAQKVQEKKATLERKFKERKTSYGKKNSLLLYELSLVTETKKEFNLQKDIRDIYVAFVREIKPTDEEEQVLNIEPVMREIYRMEDLLKAMMNWLKLKEEGPLKINEKEAFLLGNPEPRRIALTIDEFLIVYRKNRISKEFVFEKQIKVANVRLREDEQNLNRMYVREVRSILFWSKENELCVELENGNNVREFIEDFERLRGIM